MASVDTILISHTHTPGITHAQDLTPQSARKVSELLNENHARWHVVYDDYGFHNHIVHHLLSIYALGATPTQLQAAYDLNATYQVPLKPSPSPPSPSPPTTPLLSPTAYTAALGHDASYTLFLSHFKTAIRTHGYKSVLTHALFGASDAAHDLWSRMYSGLYHPIIHLGYALEYEQPLLVAEALAQAAIHAPQAGIICGAVEDVRAEGEGEGAGKERGVRSVLELAERIRADKKVSGVTMWGDGGFDKISGVLVRAFDELVSHLAAYSVAPDTLERQTAEMVHAVVYLAAGAQHPRKVPMFDFLLIHCTNLALWYEVFRRQDWIEERVKCRLLEWKVWFDMTIWAAGRAPRTFGERIERYVPREEGGWEGVFERACEYRDDGHTAKLIRVVKHAEEVSAGYQGTEGFVLKTESFLKIAHMAMDSVDLMDVPGHFDEKEERRLHPEHEKVGTEVVKIAARFVRWSGFEEAWANVPNLGPRI